MRSGMVYYSHREGITPRGKERKKMTNYIENTMEALIEEALADLEARGESLPEIRYGEEE